MLWDMSWRLGTCGGFHPIHPLVHFAAHSSYTVELNSDYSWAGAFYVFPDPLQTLPGPPRARALHPLFLNKRQPIHKHPVPHKESSSQFTYRVSISHSFITVGKVPGVPEPCLQSFYGELSPHNRAHHTLKPLRNAPSSGVLLAPLWCCFLHGSWPSCLLSLVQRYEHNPLQLPLPS